MDLDLKETDNQMMNKTQRLQRWYDDNATADSLLFGEFMHLGANQTILKVGLLGVEPNENSVVLDMACAVGGNARWLASLYRCTVYGNDIDSQAISTARDLAKIEGVENRCNFIEASVEDTGLETGSVDLVVSTDIFDIDEVVRVLKPGGRFLLSALFRLDAETPEEIAAAHGLEVELKRDVTELAQTFLHSKEEEARLLQKSNVISDRQLVQVINDALRRRGGHHLLVRWRKSA